MKSKLTLNDTVTIAMCVALAVVLGKVLGLLHQVLPFARSTINAPVFCFIIGMILYRIRKPGAISLFAIVYGLFMARISVISTVAIAVGGIVADILIRLIVRDYKSDLKIALCTPLYSVSNVIASLVSVTLFVRKTMFTTQAITAMLISAIVVYAVGLVGSIFNKVVFRPYIFWEIFQFF